MDILGIGITEIAVIMVVGVIFLGPAKIVEIASKMGFYWRTAQGFLREAADAATIKLDLPESNPVQPEYKNLEEPSDSIKRAEKEPDEPDSKNSLEENR